MNKLPSTAGTTVLRTDFSDPAAWDRLQVTLATPTEEDFLAGVTFIDDPAYGDLTDQQVLECVPDDYTHAILVVADNVALAATELPLLVVDPRRHDRAIRVVATELWSIENNLSLANMDFEEFAANVDGDGIFRGF